MKIIITGLPYFGSRIASQLRAADPQNKYIFLNTYYSRLDKLRYLMCIGSADVVYSINGATNGSKAISMALRKKKKVVFHWVGTDLLLAREAVTNGTADRDYLEKPVHITDSPWFVDELAELGINAQYAPLLFVSDPPGELPLPRKFTVLAYIPEGNEKFYGFGNLIYAALEMPETDFIILGLAKYSEELPANIKLLGWVDDMSPIYRESSVTVRMPEHDGLSFFVLESLIRGRHVIYNQPLQHCRIAKDRQELIAELKTLKKMSDEGLLMPNSVGRDYVIRNFTREKVIDPLVRLLTSE